MKELITVDNPYMSAIIPTFNSSKTVAKLLQSLQPLVGQDFEAIVVDDASTDDTVAVCHQFDWVRVVIQERNAGPSAARNRGALEARGQVLLFLDDDAIIYDPPLITEMIRRFREVPQLTTISTISRRDPENPGFLPAYTAGLEYYVYQQAISGEVMNPWHDFSTRCGAIRRSLFEATGGFDTSYHMPSVEDAEFYYRVVSCKPGILLARYPIGHHWPAKPIKLLRNYFVRAALWTPLFMKRKQFDEVLTTRGESITKLTDVVSFTLVVLGFFYGWSLLAGVALFAVSLYRKRGLLRAFYGCHGALFTAKAALLHYISSVVLLSGAAWGVASLYWRALVKKPAAGN